MEVSITGARKEKSDWHTCSTSEQLIKNDSNRIKPIQRVRLATIRDVVSISLAVIP